MSKLNIKFNKEDTSRIIEMAWDDRTSFQAITVNFGISEKQVMRIMRNNLKTSSYRLWRKRIKYRSIKDRQAKKKPLERGS